MRERTRDATPRLENMLVVIGAMKCGTSSLHEYLDLHPEIGMCRPKEPDFLVLEKNWRRGFDWYRRRFPRNVKVRGDSSTNYSKCHLFGGVPERMKACMPDATLVYVMRDPIERIVSHYMTNVSHANEDRSFKECMEDLEDNKYVETSRYHKQIQRYLEHFDRSSMLLFTLEELHEKPERVLAEIFEKVGVDPHFCHEGFRRIHHESQRKGRPTRLGFELHRHRGGRYVRYALPFLFERPLVRPVLTAELSARLEEALRPDVEALRELWGRPLSSWSV
jgi:hypothetical protein